MRNYIFVMGMALALAPSLFAQGVRPIIRPPSAEAIQQADAMVEHIFTRLQEGRSQELAEWLVNAVHFAESATARAQQVNDYRSQFETMLLGPPDGAFGDVDGYDLIEESYLPGSNRFFRRTYLVYHEGVPVVWELRFYVQPDGNLSLNAFGFTAHNPFEYLATPDMLLNRWFDWP